MLVGHHAVGLAAKRIAPRVSVGTLMVAAVFLDLLVFVDQLMGIEHARITPGITAFTGLDGYDVAISHSLLTSVLWAALFGLVYHWCRRDIRAALVLAAVVLSHWVLDFVSHRPELPLAPGVRGLVGLGLWNSIPLTFAIEGALWILGIVIYLRTTRSTSRVGTYGLLAFVGVPTLMWVSTPFSSPPPGDFSHAVLLIFMGLVGGLCLVAYWVDRHRAVLPELADTRSVMSAKRGDYIGQREPR